MPATLSPHNHIQAIAGDYLRHARLKQPDAENGIEFNAWDNMGMVQLLADSLYAKQIHFVMELIQNAEDNDYADQVEPALSFILYNDDPTDTPEAEGALLIVNNERGFQPEHINAICQIGKSTKNKVSGYIGEKGIGFKSVFQVSRRPHIFSSGYQFYFDEERDAEAAVGYVFPYWLDHIPEIINPYRDQTCILLPLKPGRRARVAEELTTLAPESLLFLKRLQHVSFHTDAAGSLVLSRSQSNTAPVRLTANQQTYDYWLVGTELSVPPEIKEPQRDGVKTRTVHVAFPLTQHPKRVSSVFAYLPTEERLDLPFLINADFILTSDRASVRHDLAWNVWLRDQIADLYLVGFRQLLDTPEYRTRTYTFIPHSVGPYHEFFSPMLNAMVEQLRTSAVVLTADGQSFVEPWRARFASPLLRQLVPLDDLPPTFREIPFVHLDLEPYHEQLARISVTELEAHELLAYWADADWLARRPPAWFAKLYRFLAEHLACEEALRALRAQPVILTADETLVAAESIPVYLPNDDLDELYRLAKEHADIFSFAVLHPQLYHLIADDHNLLDWLGCKLGIVEFSVARYCCELARQISCQRTALSPDRLIELTSFLRKWHTSLSDAEFREMARLLPLLYVNARKPAPWHPGQKQPLVLPANADPDTGWQLAFPSRDDRDPNWRILSPRYIQHDPEQCSGWVEFFERLGATRTPPPKQVMYRGEPSWREIKASPALTALSGEWKDRKLVVTNSPALSWLQHLMDGGRPAPSQVHKRAVALIAWLKAIYDRWEDPPIQRSHRAEACAKWCYRNGGWEVTTQSDFFYAVHTAPWFPSTKGLLPPGDVFIRSDSLYEQFGKTLPYAKIEVPTEVQQILGLKTEVTQESAVALLEKLSQTPPTTATLEVVHKLYAFLDQHGVQDLRECFESQPLIFVPRPHPRWITVGEALWPSLPEGMDSPFVSLEPIYGGSRRIRHGLYHFFVKQLGVREQVDDQLYANAYLALSRAEHPDPVHVEAALAAILPVLSRVGSRPDSFAWWPAFCEQALIWTQAHRFVPASEVFIPDSRLLSDLFQTRDVAFTWYPPGDRCAEYESFYRALGVRSLSESLKSYLDDVLGTPTVPLSALLTSEFKRWFCYFLMNEVSPAYDRARASGLLEKLLRSDHVVVPGFTVVHELAGTSITLRQTDSIAYWDHAGQRLYTVAQKPNSVLARSVADLLARQFVEPDDYKLASSMILNALLLPADELAEYIDASAWHMPRQDQRWLREILGTWPTRITAADGKAAVNEPKETHRDVHTPALGGHLSVQDTAAIGDAAYDGDPSAHTDELHKTKENQEATATTGQANYAHAASAAVGRGYKRSINVRTSQQRLRARKPQPRIDLYLSTSYDEDADWGGRTVASFAQTAVEWVISLEHAEGWEVTDENDTHPNHPGWDLTARRAVAGAEGDGKDTDEPAYSIQEIKYIEVKSKQGQWDEWGIGLTPAQYAAAREHGPNYYLYVVEFAEDARQRRLYIFKDPVKPVTAYRLGRNWRLLASRVIMADQTTPSS